MPARRVVKRILVSLLAIPLALLVLAFLFIQIEQHILRHRAERLLADFHQIHLHQTTWSDAQAIMQRWAKWGRSDGECSATNCRYDITLGDPVTSFIDTHVGIGNWLRIGIFRSYYALGGKYIKMMSSFIVQDGTIWRTSSSLMVGAKTSMNIGDDGWLALVIVTKSRGSLHRDPRGEWVLGGDDQIGDHPYYKAGRLGGCTFCKEVMVTYGTHTPQPEILRLTSFNFSCITRLHPCRDPEDLLPAAQAWHLYDEKPPPASPSPEVPIWTLARDVHFVFVVDAISHFIKTPSGEEARYNANPYEVANVRLIESLKGTAPSKPGAEFQIKLNSAI